MSSASPKVFHHYSVLLVLVYQNHLQGERNAVCFCSWMTSSQCRAFWHIVFSLVLFYYPATIWWLSQSPRVQRSVSPAATRRWTKVFIPLMRNWYTYVCLSGWTLWPRASYMVIKQAEEMSGETEEDSKREGGKGMEEGIQWKYAQRLVNYLSLCLSYSPRVCLFSPQRRAERGQGYCSRPGQGFHAWDGIPLISTIVQPGTHTGREQASIQLSGTLTSDLCHVLIHPGISVQHIPMTEM